MVSGVLHECHTHTAYWMIDCCFSPDQSQIVTLSDSIKVTYSNCWMEQRLKYSVLNLYIFIVWHEINFIVCQNGSPILEHILRTPVYSFFNFTVLTLAVKLPNTTFMMCFACSGGARMES